MKMYNINEEALYPMRWDAVLKYADVQAGTFAAYQLPAVVPVPPPPPPTNQTKIAEKKYV